MVRPVIFEDELIVVTHRSLTKAAAVPGFLLVETRRHTPNLSSLTDAEASAVGRAVARAARALQRELAPEFVFSSITGRTVAHFHQRVFARPFGTPPTIPWTDVDSWPESPRITIAELIALSRRLSTHFSPTPP
ncbi:HIT family protein [Nocardia sp. CA-128927]|uniref:HIT family protein n=1 Tax=Nocardia sp. CA-128927 TaxID=3239975 RepID=UPI003D990003